MKIYISIFNLFCTFCSTQLLAQETINSIYNTDHTDDTFEYNNELHEFPDMNEIFKQDYNAHEIFSSALIDKKKVKQLTSISLAAMSFGTIAPILDPPGNVIVSYGLFIGLVSWLIVVPTAGIVKIITKNRYHQKKHKAISLFNNFMEMGYIDYPKSWDLKVGSCLYGYGLVVNF